MNLKPFQGKLQSYFRTQRGSIVGLWAAYFLYWGSIAPFVPYLGLYLESVQLSGNQIGQLGSLRALVSFFSAIALAFLSDVLRRRKLILLICVVGMIAALILFPYMASFATLLPVVVLYSIFQSPAIAILDEDTLRALENPRDYSMVRMGGSLGWGIMVFLAGLILNRPDAPLSVMFSLHIVLLLPLLGLIIFLPAAHQNTPKETEKARFSDILDLMRFPGFALWMGIIFLFGLTEASMINFLFLHIKSLGGNSIVMGLAMVMAIVGEIAGFAVAKRLQGRIGSRRMMVISFVFRLVWFILMALIRQPAVILPVLMLSGGSFAMIEAGSVAYVNERAPRKIGTTAQGVRSAILIRLSMAVGSLLAGWLYQDFGSGVMYGAMGAFSAASLVLAIRLRAADRRREALKSL